MKSKGHLLYRFIIFSFSIYFKLCYRYRVYGYQHYIPGSAIIAPNHVSFFDPPAVAIGCGEEIHFLARHTLFRSVLGYTIRRLNTHPVQHNVNNLQVMKTICQLLNEGKKVLVFPEGSRSADDTIQAIKPGIGMLLSRSQSAILPVYIDGTYEVWSRTRKLPKLFGKISVVFGSPILWEDYADMDKKEAQKLIAQRLTQSLDELRRWYREGAQGTPP